MNVKTAISIKVKQLMAEQGLDQNALSKLSKVSSRTIKGIVNNDSKKVTLATIVKLCKVLNISVSEFFDDIVNNPLLIAS